MPRLSEGDRVNFETLCDAADAGRLALMQCVEKATGKDVAVVCAVNVDESGEYEMVPLARLFDCDPYEVLSPPTTSA